MAFKCLEERTHLHKGAMWTIGSPRMYNPIWIKKAMNSLKMNTKLLSARAFSLIMINSSNEEIRRNLEYLCSLAKVIKG